MNEIKEYENQGKKVTRFSITGYSLGGLLARYIIGYVLRYPVYTSVLTWGPLRILHQSKFFEKVIPVNFNTVATPHIGIPRFPSTFSAIANYIGPRFLSRTGEQFFCVDKWSPKGRPLVDILADPGQYVRCMRVPHGFKCTYRSHFLSSPPAFSQYKSLCERVSRDKHDEKSDIDLPTELMISRYLISVRRSRRLIPLQNTRPTVLKCMYCRSSTLQVLSVPQRVS